VLSRLFAAGILCLSAYAPLYIGFHSLRTVFLDPAKLDLFFVVVFTICAALAYFLLLVAYRAATGRGRKSDDGLLPPMVMRGFVYLFCAIGIGICGMGIWLKQIPPILGGAAYAIISWRYIRRGGAGIEDTPVDFTCRELVEAVTLARASLPYFLEQVDKNVDGAYIKFPLQTPRGATVHIWAYVHSFRDSKFNVSLANKPYGDLEETGRRDVSVHEIEDWQIIQQDGKIKGAYSLIALFQNRKNQGKSLTPRMKRQKAQLLDAPQ